MRPKFLFFATVMFSVAALAQQAAWTFRIPDDVEKFSKSYYQNPRPEIVANLIEAMPMSGFFKRANSAPPFIAFFSEVFIANPTRLPDWKVLIEKQDEETKAELQRAIALSKAGGVMSIDGHSAAINDMYWGAFFASGKPSYVNKLIAQLQYWDERDDFDLFMAGATARWSLASNAQSHALVRSTLDRKSVV